MSSKLYWLNYAIILISGTLYCGTFYFRASIGPLVDILEDEFNTTYSRIGLMSSLFWFGYFIMQIPSGIILEIFHGEFIVMIGLSGLCITSLLFSLSTNIILSSIILLICGVLVSPGWLAIISIISTKLGNNFVPFWCPVILLFSKTFLLGMTALQSYIYDTYYHWREIYYVFSVLCLISLVILLYLVIINDGQRYSKLPAVSATTSENKSECFPIFRQNKSERKFECGLIKKALLNYRNYLCGFYVFGIYSLLSAFNGLWLITFLMIKYGYSRFSATFISGLWFISGSLFGLIFGALSTKYKRKKIFMIIGALMCSGSIFIIYLPSNTNVSVIIILNLISGGGSSVLGVSPYALTREYNEYYNCANIAGGIVNTIGTSSGFFIQYLIGFLMDINWNNRIGDKDQYDDRIYTADDYQFGFMVVPIVIAVSFIISLFVTETYGQNLQYDKQTITKPV